MRKKSKLEKMMGSVVCKIEITAQRDGICFMRHTPAIPGAPLGNWAEAEEFEYQGKDVIAKLNELLGLNFEDMDTSNLISLGPVGKLIIDTFTDGSCRLRHYTGGALQTATRHKDMGECLEEVKSELDMPIPENPWQTRFEKLSKTYADLLKTSPDYPITLKSLLHAGLIEKEDIKKFVSEGLDALKDKKEKNET